jgi:hypothetical protein
MITTTTVNKKSNQTIHSQSPPSRCRPLSINLEIAFNHGHLKQHKKSDITSLPKQSRLDPALSRNKSVNDNPVDPIRNEAEAQNSSSYQNSAKAVATYIRLMFGKYHPERGKPPPMVSTSLKAVA